MKPEHEEFTEKYISNITAYYATCLAYYLFKIITD
jgi:hypothetical protein